MGWQMIESQTLSASAASVTFSNIPGTYKTIKVLLSARTTAAAVNSNARITFNSVTSSTYTNRYLYNVVAGSTAGSSSETVAYFNVQINGDSATASTFANCELTVPNYAGSANKVSSTDAVNENNATSAAQVLVAQLWANTNAITSLTATAESGNFVFGSTFTLYGLA